MGLRWFEKAELFAEVASGTGEAIPERDGGLPAEEMAGTGDVRAAALRVYRKPAQVGT